MHVLFPLFLFIHRCVCEQACRSRPGALCLPHYLMSVALHERSSRRRRHHCTDSSAKNSSLFFCRWHYQVSPTVEVVKRILYFSPKVGQCLISKPDSAPGVFILPDDGLPRAGLLPLRAARKELVRAHGALHPAAGPPSGPCGCRGACRGGRRGAASGPCATAATAGRRSVLIKYQRCNIKDEDRRGCAVWPGRAGPGRWDGEGLATAGVAAPCRGVPSSVHVD